MVALQSKRLLLCILTHNTFQNSLIHISIVYVNRCIMVIVNVWKYLMKINPKKCFKCTDLRFCCFIMYLSSVDLSFLVIFSILLRMYNMNIYTSEKFQLRYVNVTQWAARYVTDGKCVDSWNNKTLSCKVLSKRLMYWSKGIAVITYYTCSFCFLQKSVNISTFRFQNYCCLRIYKPLLLLIMGCFYISIVALLND